MSKVKLISIGFAAPQYSYNQEQAFQILSYPKAWWRMFRDSGIAKRHFVIPLSDAVKLSFQEQQERYKVEAVNLSKQAIFNTLDGRNVRDIGCLIYNSCTGYVPGPTAPHFIASDLNYAANVRILNMSGLGCEGALPGIKSAYDHVASHGGYALSVNCELSSLAYWPERENPDDVVCRPDPEDDYEVLRANAVFADAAIAALVGDDDDWRHPEILDTETHINPEYADELGFEWRNGRLRVILSRRVPDLAPLVVKPAVWAVLNRNDLDIWNINWWVIHAAGLSVIDNIGKALGLPEEKLQLSRETLRLYGNTSSTSVGITAKKLMSEKIHPGDYVGMVNVGPGMSGSMLLLQFPFMESKE